MARPRKTGDEASDYVQVTVRFPLPVKAEMDSYLPNMKIGSQVHTLVNRGLQLYPMIKAVQEELSAEEIPFIGSREVSEGDAIAFIASAVNNALEAKTYGFYSQER